MKHKPSTPKINHIVLAKTLQLLQKQPVSAHDLSAQTDVKLATAYRWLRGLHALNVVHISAWLKDTLGRDKIPVFSLGKGQDAPRYKMPREEVLSRYKAKREEQNAVRQRKTKPIQSGAAD